MSVLSDVEIVDGLVSGRIVCRPLRPENIRGASIDLTLGLDFWRCDANPHGVFNPYDHDEIVRYFAGPFEAKPYEEVYRKIGLTAASYDWPRPRSDVPVSRLGSPWPSVFKGIPADWPVIVVRPGERLLGCAHEFV